MVALAPMQIFVINLPGSPERRAFQEKQFRNLRLEATFINAVTPNHLTEDAYLSMAHGWERPLRQTELACFLSHHKAWKAILKSGEPALILEDDALLSHQLPMILQALVAAEPYDLIQLEVRSRKKVVSRHTHPLAGHFHLLDLYQDRTGAAAYVLWPSGAQKLLEKAQTTPAALADAFISSTYTLRSAQMEPAVAVQLDQCEHYQIIPPMQTQSQIDAEARPGKDYYSPTPSYRFRLRRIASQLRMGLRQLSVLFIARRRDIALEPTDFPRAFPGNLIR